MNLSDDDFTLFGLPQSFSQDESLLNVRWKALQRQTHPDQFAMHGSSAQRVAMQWSVRVNEAYQRLKDPLKRASYLCELRGAAIDAESNTRMPTEFLMQQMAWRESLDSDCTRVGLDRLKADIEGKKKELFVQIQAYLDIDKNDAALSQTVAAVRSLMFVRRFEQDVMQAMALAA